MKYLKYFLFILLLIPFTAKASNLSCTYGSGNLIVTFSFDDSGKLNKKIDSKMHGAGGGISVSAYADPLDFTNAGGQYYCPSKIYYTTSYSGGQTSMHLTFNSEGAGGNLELTASTPASEVESPSESIHMTCPYQGFSVVVYSDGEIKGYSGGLEVRVDDNAGLFTTSAVKCPENVYIYTGRGADYAVIKTEKDYTGTPSSTSTVELDYERANVLNPKLGIKDIAFCSEYLEPGVANGTLKAFQIVGYILFIVKILVPLILIGLTTVDLTKTVLKGDASEVKNGVGTVVRRIIIAIIIFFIPTILDLLLSFVDGVSEVIDENNFGNCQTCLLNPTSDDCKAHNISN